MPQPALLVRENLNYSNENSNAEYSGEMYYYILVLFSRFPSMHLTSISMDGQILAEDLDV